MNGWIFYLILLVAIFILVSISKSKKEKNNNNKGRKPYSQIEYKPGDTITTYVVGVSFENRQVSIAGLTVGMEIDITREPENQFDANAIKVYYANIDPDFGYQEKIIGYINRELAAKIAKIFDAYAVGPNKVICGTVTGLNESERKPTGVQITFKLPTEDDLDYAFTRVMYLGY